MPAPNPKHNAKKIQAIRAQQYDSGVKVNFRSILMVVIFAGVVVALIFIIRNYQSTPSSTGVYIQEYDVVQMHYKLWVDFNHTGHVDPTGDPFQDQDFSTNMTPGGLIPGFYNALLSPHRYVGDIFYIPVSSDQGYSSTNAPDPRLANTSLLFWVNVENITKSTMYPSSAAVLAISTSTLEHFLQILSIRSFFFTLNSI
jgi:hypothetical protein